MQIKLVSVLNSVLLSIKCRCYFNPSASPVVFNPLLFSLGVMFTFFATVFSMRLASNAIFLSVQLMFSKVKSARRYFSLLPTSKKLSQSMWIFFIVMLLHDDMKSILSNCISQYLVSLRHISLSVANRYLLVCILFLVLFHLQNYAE